MRITWTTSTIGDMTYFVSDDQVMTVMQALITLGFTPTVSMEDK
jgi:hypothetical protein